jgi:hypothetical protein
MDTNTIAQVINSKFSFEEITRAYYIGVMSNAVEFVEIHNEDAGEDVSPDEKFRQVMDYVAFSLGWDADAYHDFEDFGLLTDIYRSNFCNK